MTTSGFKTFYVLYVILSYSIGTVKLQSFAILVFSYFCFSFYIFLFLDV